MALNIKNAEAERLARAVAAATGETVTQAVSVALGERLDRLRDDNPTAAARRTARLVEISRDSGPRWVEPYRSGDHGDLLYDDRGLPR